MQEWLRDNWQFIVGTIIGLPGVIALYFQRRPNTLDYSDQGGTELLSRQAKTYNVALTVNYAGEPMDVPYLQRIRIQNTGKHAIRREDFVEPITLSVEGAEVRDLFISDQSSDGVIRQNDVSYPSDPTRVSNYRPALLNPGDWFEVQQLCEGRPEKTVVTSRYAGQKRPMGDLDELSQKLAARVVLTIVVLVAATCLIIGIATGFRDRYWAWPIGVVIGIMLTFMTLDTLSELGRFASRSGRRFGSRQSASSGGSPPRSLSEIP